jgi:hypothetical protein
MATTKRSLNLEEAAAYLGITPTQLERSRMRGLPPGTLGFKRRGELTFDRLELTPFRVGPSSSKGGKTKRS